MNFLIAVVAVNAAKAQQNKDAELILGKWLTEADIKSVLIFDKQYGYQLYTGFSEIDTFKYYFTDTCRFSSVRNNFMFWVSKNNVDDTTWLEIMGLNSKILSFFAFNTASPLWMLRKDKPKRK